MSLENTAQMEAIADRFSECADRLDQYLIEHAESDQFSLEESQLFAERVHKIRQQANALYVQSVHKSIQQTSDAHINLLTVIDKAKSSLSKIKDINQAFTVTGKMLELLGALEEANPGKIAKSAQELFQAAKSDDQAA